MAYLIADTEGVSTWGVLRRVVGQIYGSTYLDGPTVRLTHNIEYPTEGRFKSDATPDGLLKGGFVLGTPPFDTPSSSNRWEPTIIVDGAPLQGEMDGFDIPTYETQLTGETVTHGGGTFNITAGMFTAPEAITGYIGATPISAVGKLTAVT